MAVSRQSSYPKPVIGIAGGIGAGKSVISRELEKLGCLVIDSDRVAHEVIQRPEVRDALVSWWGRSVLNSQGEVDRRAVGQRVFGKPEEVGRLNGLVHPLVGTERERVMAQARDNVLVKAVVWDTPLLFEVGLDRECDAIIFVKVPYEKRLERIQASRGWDQAELERRENLQMALDKKQNLADYVIDNSGDVSTSLRQLHGIFSQILARKKCP